MAGADGERARALRPFPPLVALAAWATFSAGLNGSVASATSTAAVLAGVALVLLVCSNLSLAQRRHLAVVFAGLGLVVALSGWAGVAWRVSPLATDTAVHLGATTMTYANSAAAILAPLTFLALAIAMERQNAIGWTAATCVMLVGLGATASRGGLMALVVGLVVMAVVLGWRRTCRAAAPALLGAGVALGGLLPSVPAAAPARPLLAVAALGVGLSIAVAARRLPLTSLLLTALMLGLVGILALTAGPLAEPGRALAQAKAPDGWAARDDLARSALDVAARHPLIGTGPGGSLHVSSEDGGTLSVLLAHNEYLQVLADLGVVGLALTLSFLVALGRVLAGGRRSSPSHAVWAGCVAAFVGFALHSAVDVLWHVPALPLCVTMLVGITMPAGSDDS